MKEAESKGRLPGSTEPKSPAADSTAVVSCSISMNYKGREQTSRLGLSDQSIMQLALEAEFRGMKIGELMATIIQTVIKDDLFRLVLERTSRPKPSNAEPRQDMTSH